MDNDLIFGTETSDIDMLAGNAAGGVQIAAAPSGGEPYAATLSLPLDAAQVVIPEGENVVRVPVTPGEVVELPFPADSQFLAREDNGNLAIKVGDITVILQGYVEAAGTTPPVIEASNGQPIDIATILASTDPNIDIQTAAGPAAGPQGQGADNTGGILQLFGAGAGLGGFLGAGALDATEGPGNGPVDQDGTIILPFGVAAAAAATAPGTNALPELASGTVSRLRGEDQADTVQDLNWDFVDKDDATQPTIAVDPNTLPPGVTYDAVNERLVLNTQGKYDYLAPGQKEVFTIVFDVTDAHGGVIQQTFTLTMIGAADASPHGVADNVLTNVGAFGTFTVPEWAYLANDKDASTEHLIGFGAVVGFNAGSMGGGLVTLQDDAILGGKVDLLLQDASFPTLTMKNQAGGDLTGTGAQEVIVSGANGDKIDGKGGQDVIFGGGGDDTVIFHNGDIVSGGGDSIANSKALDTAATRGDVLVVDHSVNLQTLNLTHSDGIETISTKDTDGGAGVQNLTIGAGTVTTLSDHTIQPGGVFTEHEAVRIDGDAVDQLYLSISKDPAVGGGWADTGIDVNGYSVYAHETTAGNAATADAYVMVSNAIPTANVHLNTDHA